MEGSLAGAKPLPGVCTNSRKLAAKYTAEDPDDVCRVRELAGVWEALSLSVRSGAGTQFRTGGRAVSKSTQT